MSPTSYPSYMVGLPMALALSLNWCLDTYQGRIPFVTDNLCWLGLLFHFERIRYRYSTLVLVRHPICGQQ